MSTPPPVSASRVSLPAPPAAEIGNPQSAIRNGPTPALEYVGVVKTYGRRRALDGLNLKIPSGSLCGLVGSNGAGKTTTLTLAAGLVFPTAGHVRVGGRAFDPAARSGRLTLLPQDAELPREGRPLELLVFYGELQGLARREARAAAQEMLERVHLADRAESPVRSLSHGMRKRLMIAQCFLGNPEIVLLDEPLSGLDPREAARVREFIGGLRGRRTIVISSHDLHEIERMCDHVAFIEKGRTVRMDSLEAVTGRRGLLVYRLAGDPPMETLAAAVPEAALEWDPAQRRLLCRHPESLAAAEINRRLIPVLFDACAGVITIEQGERLETEYLRQSV